MVTMVSVWWLKWLGLEKSNHGLPALNNIVISVQSMGMKTTLHLGAVSAPLEEFGGGGVPERWATPWSAFCSQGSLFGQHESEEFSADKKLFTKCYQGAATIWKHLSYVSRDFILGSLQTRSRYKSTFLKFSPNLSR